MTKRFALVALVLSTVAVTAAYGAAFLPGETPPWAPWLLALGTSAMMVAVMALGALRGGRAGDRRRRVLGWSFALTFVITAGALALALAMRDGEGPGTPLWLGLPPRAAVVLYGVGLLPMLYLPFVYALTFDEGTLGEDDLARVRAAREAREAREAGAAGGTAGDNYWGAPPEQQGNATPSATRHSAAAAAPVTPSTPPTPSTPSTPTPVAAPRTPERV